MFVITLAVIQRRDDDCTTWRYRWINTSAVSKVRPAFSKKYRGSSFSTLEITKQFLTLTSGMNSLYKLSANIEHGINLPITRIVTQRLGSLLGVKQMDLFFDHPAYNFTTQESWSSTEPIVEAGIMRSKWNCQVHNYTMSVAITIVRSRHLYAFHKQKAMTHS